MVGIKKLQAFLKLARELTRQRGQDLKWPRHRGALGCKTCELRLAIWTAGAKEVDVEIDDELPFNVWELHRDPKHPFCFILAGRYETLKRLPAGVKRGRGLLERRDKRAWKLNSPPRRDKEA